MDHAASLARTPVLRRTAAERPQASRSRTGAGLPNHRPAAVAQRRLAELVNTSRRVAGATLPHSSRTSAPVIQRVIAGYTAGSVPAALRTPLGAALDAYNAHAGTHAANNSQGSVHRAFELLDAVELMINHYLRHNSLTVTEPQRLHLFALLRAAQTDHEALTARNVAAAHPLWLRHTGTLGAVENQRRQTLWQSLVARAGNVQVEAGAGPGFGNAMDSHFSRLLQGGHGTGLLADLNAAQGGDATRQIVISNNLTNIYAGLGRAAPEPASFAYPQALLRTGANRHYRLGTGGANTGTGSFVQVVPRTPTTIGEHFVDTDGRALHAPAFISLGHELGHARHALAGTTAEESWDGHAVTDPFERALWSRPEEHANITTEENPLRAEHQMPERTYHTTVGDIPALRNKRRVKASLATLIASLTPAQHETYGLILSDLTGEFERFNGVSDTITARLCAGCTVATLKREYNKRWWARMRGRATNAGRTVVNAGRAVRAAITPRRLLGVGALAVAGIGLYMAAQRREC